MLALALAGLARLASRVEAADLATSPLRTTICAAGGGCEDRQKAPGRTARGRAFVVPPLLPLTPGARPGPARKAAGRSSRFRDLAGRARRPAGRLWRRAWLICFGYERVRYGLLHPETRPRQTVPISGALQMVNDCVSPIDFSRDWELLRPR
jgi:hypothetical protein